MKDDSTDSLPRGWARVPLSEVTIEKVDQAGPKSGVQAFDYIDISSVDNETKVIGSPKRMEPKDAPSRAKQNLRADDILVSMTRPNLNAVSIVPAKLAGAIGSTGFDVLRATDAVDPGWLFMVVRSAKFVDAMTERVQGALYPAVRPRDIRAFEIPLPPLPEQRRIVAKVEAVLARVNAARQRLAKVPALLKRFRQSTLAAACSGKLTADWREVNAQAATSDSAPQGWRTTKLGEAITRLEQGWSPQCEIHPSASDDQWGVIKTTAVQHLAFDGRENKALPATLAPRPELELKAGDLLITRAGPRVRAGVCCYVKSVRPRLIVCDKVYRFRVNLKFWNPEFISLCLNEPITLDQIEALKTGISDSGVNLTQNKFKDLELPVPSLPEQREIVRRVEALFALADKIEARVTAASARADKLIQSTLAKAFRGELVPTEAELAELEGREFETAQALLDRIHDERNCVAPSPGRNGSRRSASVPRKAELRIK